MSPKDKPQVNGKWGGVLVFAFLGVFLILGTGYFFYGLQPGFQTAGPVTFKITKGESFKDVQSRLLEAGLVRSATVFKLYAFLTGSAQKIQPGVYVFASTMSVPEITQTLVSPGGNEVVVVIPEGATVKDIDMILARTGVLGEGEFLRLGMTGFRNKYAFLSEAKSFEGFVFPDTYRFERESSVETVMEKMLQNFEAKAWPTLQGRRGWYNELVLASYLEREVPGYADRTIVSGILLKRVKLGMLLQVDATISYAKCNGRFLNCENVQIERGDLRIASPYNTYARAGWTPTPIANPGQEAIRAAASPARSDYLYYLSERKSGKTIFSKTLEEHNLNRQKYL